jgi:murein L,D-transpeptidase YcbB/YkuD
MFHQRQPFFSTPRRSLFHLPLAWGGKILAVLTLKKVAVITIINKIGVTKTIDHFRTLNNFLYNSQQLTGKVYSKGLYDSVNSGLDTLEMQLLNLQNSEQVRRVWDWVQSLDKSNPTFVNAVVKSYLERFGPYKWMRAVMSEKKSAAGSPGYSTQDLQNVKDAEIYELPSDEEPSTVDVNMQTMSEEEYDALMKELHKAFPQLQDHHVVLIPKERKPAQSHD